MPRLLLHETGIHYIDVLRYLVGDVTEVYAKLRTLNGNIAGEDCALVQKTGDRYAQGRATAVNAVNHELVLTYWEIGRYIVEFEQAGARKAGYGKQLINKLAKDLTKHLGKGFGRTNLNYIRLFYVKFPKSGTLSRFLSWSHYYELLKLDSDNARSFYEQQTIIEKWSVR